MKLANSFFIFKIIAFSFLVILKMLKPKLVAKVDKVNDTLYICMYIVAYAT